MKKVVLLRYGEIHLKGKNRAFFENILMHNLQKTLGDLNCAIYRISGRYLVSNFDESLLDEIVERSKKVFGFVSLSVANEVDSNESEIVESVFQFVQEHNKKTNNGFTTFKVKTKRADKKFPIHSDDFSALIGEKVLEKFDNFKVNLSHPEFEIEIDIRENGKTYVFCGERIACVGGMPVGSSGSGLLMLSGGIDSPVAGYMMAKRGLKIYGLHFHSYPYTSLQAKEKVLTLAKKLCDYTGGEMQIFMVPFTHIQEEIHKNCESAYMINIMRRIMFRISEILCKHNKFQTVITGENLGQVASQTIESLTNTNSVMKAIPVMRPLIAFDKIDIIKIAKEIDTYETSILPYEDCCTVFLPENPIIKPKIENSLKQESYLNIDELIANALSDIEVITVKNK